MIEFADLVRRMRMAQRAYFTEGGGKARLIRAKQLEHEVDACVRKIMVGDRRPQILKRTEPPDGSTRPTA